MAFVKQYSWLLIIAMMLCPFRLSGCGEGSTTPDPGGIDPTGPDPRIYRIEPPSAPAGAEVAIIGADFEESIKDNVVRFSDLQATVINVTQGEEDRIIAQVPGELQPGLTFVTVTVDESQSNKVPFEITAGRSYPVGEKPSSVVIGDLDENGTPDLAVTNGDSEDVSVLLGNGDGTFQKARRYGTGWGPSSVAIGDLNGDGVPDLAVANRYSNDVDVLQGDGDGTFHFGRS